jgi:hypothetical protein
MTPDELEKKVSAYFAECAAQDVFPDRADMIIYLGLPTNVYQRYETGEDDRCAAFSEVLKKARFMREGWLSRVMFSDKNKAQSAMFHLRQPSNGGYSERQEAQGGLNIRLKLGDGESDLVE